MMLGSKASDPMMPSDFCVFHTPEIRKTFEIRYFSCGKQLLSHCYIIYLSTKKSLKKGFS